MIDLSNRTILVCGGSGVIGAEVCRVLARCGASVLPTYRENKDNVPKVNHRASGGWIQPPVHLNITDPGSIEDVAGLIAGTVGIDGFVNCTGINIPKSFDQVTPADWAVVHQVNLDGSFRLAKSLLHLVEDGGSIVFIGSVSSALGGPTSVHYASSKSGLVALTRGLALFAAPRQIRVNCVSPGYIQSEMAERGQQTEAVRRKVEQIPLGRLGRVEEVAGVVAFLMSDWASYVTGQEWGVNGGLAW